MPAKDEVGRRLCVLVVEDEVFIAMELQGALLDHGFDVLGPVGSVGDALDLINETRPDAAVLDFNLGNERVTPVAVLLKALGVPFVMASATGPTELLTVPILSGVLNLGKPTNLKSLVEAIHALRG